MTSFCRARKRFLPAALCLALGILFVCWSWIPVIAAGTEEASFNASGNRNQTPSVDPTGRSEGFSAVLYNNLNGLPTSEANAIAQTDDGFIWIGSYAGLIRYDGNTFERMDSTNGITSVTSLFVDSRDRLWIGTNANGVAMMVRGVFRIWDVEDGLKSESVRAITEGGDGLIYAACTSGVAIIDDEMNVKAIEDARIADAYIRDLRVGADGLVYGLTQTGDLFSLRGDTIETFLSQNDCRIKGVIGFSPDPAHPGNLYLGTENSSVYYGRLQDNFETTRIFDITPLSYVERFESISGEIWVCAGNGIGKLTDSGFSQLNNIPMDNSVCHVMTDYEGNLWFTSTRQGVMKVVPNQFSDLFEQCGLPAAVVNSTCKYEEQLFLATDSGLIVVENGKQVEHIPLTQAVTASGKDLGVSDLIEYLAGVRIRSIIRDSKGRLWIATWRKHGLLRYDGNEVVAFTVDDGLLSDRVRVVCERADGTILVANTGGVSILDGERVIDSYGEESGIVNGEILTVAEGKNGDIILGSDGGGIYVIGANGTTHIGRSEGLSSEVIMRIKRDISRDLFWIVTTNSIEYMDDDYHVTTIQKFPFPNNFDLYENSRGDVWILAGNGIYVSSVDELLANGEISPVFYNHDSGFTGTTTANSYSELTSEGDLYIAGTTGAFKVNIEQPFQNVSDLKAAVPYLEADGNRIDPDESGVFVIPSNTRKITIYSFVFNYSLSNPQVSYRLEGVDKQSVTVRRNELMPADYTNLRGGSYRFVMEISDAMGRGSKTVSVEIVKQKAIYEQLWFMILGAVLLLLLIALGAVLYVRLKTRRLLAKEKEQKEVIREVTEVLAKTIDMKDKYTNGHSIRVAKYTQLLARELGYDQDTIEKYYNIALLHDIGKISVPEEVLNKNGKLDDTEYSIIKSHAALGYEALKDIHIMPELAIGAGAHHERPDGKGYPRGLSGDEIPRVAQIIAVADTFDAMYSDRPYRKRMNFDKIVSIMKEVSGTQLAPDVVEAFLRLAEKGVLRAPDDNGGGTTEDIDNLRRRLEREDRDAKDGAAD